jgi:hypothetical protein
MNIRETIARLNKAAAELPAGLDSDVHVRVCDELDDDGVLVDLAGGVAVVRGHPHRDVPLDADEALKKWVGDEARGGAT